MAGIGILTIPTVVQAGEEVLAEDNLRRKAVIQNNDGANNVVIKPDANPANDTDGIILTPGDRQEIEFRNSLWARSNNVAGTLISVLVTRG